MKLKGYDIIFALLMGALMITAAYCQEKPDNHLIKTINGTVMNTDSVGNTIAIRTEDQKQLTFFVPDKTTITQEAHAIGLMDIGESSLVTIQYYVSPSFKNIVINIVDNESVVNE